MSRRGTTLYSIPMSHPGHAVRLMLDHKRIEHDVRYILTGFQAPALRVLGFPGGTTPALRIEGRRLQGSREIAAALDEIEPEPALFPADPQERRAVLAAEEWGEREFQPVPRRLLRWGLRNVDGVLEWMFAGEMRRMGLGRIADSRFLARTTMPLSMHYARVSGATAEAARADLERLASLLDTIAEMIDAGTIGGARPNAADFQIATTARVLYAMDDLRPVLEGSAAAALGLRLFPDFDERVPAFLPEDWLP